MSVKKGNTVELPSIDLLRQELYRVRYRSRYGKMLRSTLSMLLVMAAGAVLLATLWLPVLRIVGGSMAPTLHPGDIVICVKDSQTAPGELVSFYVGNKLLVKRCIAGPGQWVDIDTEGNVFVDGVLLEEPYAVEKARGNGDLELPCQVPEGCFFSLGDHRGTSLDSRSAAVGFVEENQIAGRPVLRLWPLSRAGLLQ